MRWSLKSNQFKVLVILIAVLNFLVLGSQAKLNFCDVETGQTNIILDIEESRGNRKYRSLFSFLSSDYEQFVYWTSSELGFA